LKTNPTLIIKHSITSQIRKKSIKKT